MDVRISFASSKILSKGKILKQIKQDFYALSPLAGLQVDVPEEKENRSKSKTNFRL